MGFFRTGTGSKLVKNTPADAAEQTATIPVVTDTVEDDTASAYAQQTKKAKEQGISNCPMCVQEDGANKSKIYKQSEMEADHVTAWSKGGATTLSNCQMLCTKHNRMKGNR